jgi:hypothetical protein
MEMIGYVLDILALVGIFAIGFFWELELLNSWNGL